MSRLFRGIMSHARTLARYEGRIFSSEVHSMIQTRSHDPVHMYPVVGNLQLRNISQSVVRADETSSGSGFGLAASPAASNTSSGSGAGSGSPNPHPQLPPYSVNESASMVNTVFLFDTVKQDKVKVPAVVARALSVHNASLPELNNLRKQFVIKEYGLHARDDGSPEVQIALLTHRLRSLEAYISKYKKNVPSRLRVPMLKRQRRKMALYLLRESRERFDVLLKKLKLPRTIVLPPTRHRGSRKSPLPILLSREDDVEIARVKLSNEMRKKRLGRRKRRR